MYKKIIKALFESVSDKKKFDKTVALVAGSFKPPHFAHLYMVMEYVKQADEVIVIISNPKSEKSLRKTSLGTIITPEMSKQIWDLYLDKYGLSNKVSVIVSPSPSPIGAMFEYIDSGAVDNTNIILGVSKKDDDLSRFKSVEKQYTGMDNVHILTPSKYAVEPFKSNGKNVSATDIRNNIDDFEKVKELLPEKLSDKDVKHVMKILGVESIKEAKNDLHIVVSRYDDFEFTVKGELKHREIKPCEIVHFIDDSFECDIVMKPQHGLGHNDKISNCEARIVKGTSRNPKIIEVKHPRTGTLYMFDPKNAEVYFDVLRVFPLDKDSECLLQVKLSVETMKYLM
jgi:cytidyltransferase-like protein